MAGCVVAAAPPDDVCLSADEDDNCQWLSVEHLAVQGPKTNSPKRTRISCRK